MKGDRSEYDETNIKRTCTFCQKEMSKSVHYSTSGNLYSKAYEHRVTHGETIRNMCEVAKNQTSISPRVEDGNLTHVLDASGIPTGTTPEQRWISFSGISGWSVADI